MLTEKQIKIIDDLKIEFTKINTPIQTTSGGLINKSLMDKKFNDTIKRKAEIDAINRSTERYISDLIDKDIDRLNKDLLPMGMAATRAVSEEDQKIFFGRLYGLNSFYIQYYSDSKYEQLPDGSGMNVKKGFGYIKHWEQYNSSANFKSIDELCDSPDFIKRIEGIYLSALKDK